MSVLQAIILGIIQGITEFLPVSSSGHLILMPKILGWSDQGLAFDAIMHLATGVAIMIVLWNEIVGMFNGFFSRKKSEIRNPKFETNSKFKIKNAKLFLWLAAIIPAGVAGYLLHDLVENKFRSVELVAINLIFWGVVLFIAERVNSFYKERRGTEKLKDALVVGGMQILALLPGTSRSGITITGGLFSGLSRKRAVNFSFLAGLPLILAAGIMKFVEVWGILECADFLPLVVGFFSALVSGILAIKLLQWVAEKASFRWLVIYRVVLGIALLAWFV